MSVHDVSAVCSIELAKLTAPDLPPYYIQRQQLFEKLLQNLSWKIILVEAPVGYGKTVLLSEWCHLLRTQKPHYQAAWLSLDAKDDDLLRFYNHFIAAVVGMWPELDASEFAVDSTKDIRQAFVSLSNYLHLETTKDSREYVVFIDNIDAVSAKTALTLLGYCADCFPSRVHVVAAGSRFPSSFIDFARWDSVHMVPPKDLVFSKSESYRLIRNIFKNKVSDNTVENLFTLTQGWAAGIRIYSESIITDGDLFENESALEQVNPLVDRFFKSIVFENTSDEVISFLLETSIFESFCSDMCNYVTKRTDSATIINRLIKQNFFIEQCDALTHWYHYHPLFLSWLREKFMDLEADRMREICFRASEWFGKRGNNNESAKYMLMAGDWDLIENLANAGGFKRENVSISFFAWIARKPSCEFPSDPSLSLLASWGYYCAARASEALEWLQIFKQNLLNAEAAYADTAHKEKTNEGVTQGEAASLSSSAAVVDFITIKCKNFDGHYDETIADLNTLLATYHDINPALRCIIMHALGETYERIGNYRLAQEYYLQSEALAQLTHSDFFVAFSLYAFCWVLVYQGNWIQALEMCEGALSECPPDYTLYGALCGLLAYIHIELFQLEKAEYYLDAAFRSLSSNRNRDMLFEANCIKARYYAAQDKLIDAYCLIVQTVTLAESVGVPRGVLPFAYMTKAQIALARNNTQEMLDTAEKMRASINPEDSLYAISAGLITSQAAGKRGEYGRSLALAREVIENASAVELESLVVAGMIQEVIMFDAMGAKSQALSQLNETLRVASPQKTIMPFLREGEIMQTLLHELVNIRKTSNAVRVRAKQILGAFVQAQEEESEVSKPESKESSFTNREKEIYVLLSSGLSRSEIASSLCLSENTIKTHLKNIYHKLGVNNRVDAFRVMKADEAKSK